MLNSTTPTGNLGLLTANTGVNELNIDLVGLNYSRLEYLLAV